MGVGPVEEPGDHVGRRGVWFHHHRLLIDSSRLEWIRRMIRLRRPDVKSRSYDSTGRRARALARRERVITAARDRFLTDGYAAATVATIADDADVSVDTIYKGFGGKVGLLEAAWLRALEGRGNRPAEQRADAAAVRADGPSMIHTWATLSAEVAAE